MSSEKQLVANKLNAQLSLGPMTPQGKTTVSKNAIKHGIFSKDLIVSSEIGDESMKDYLEILHNLFDCLSPCNQIESLLVEKIAVDFWRLRRAIRFETGSISQTIKTLMKDFYSRGRRNNDEIDKEIQQKKETISWNSFYLKHLSSGEVNFDKPEWSTSQFISDIAEDFYMILRSVKSLISEETERVYSRSYALPFEELQALVKKHGYSDSNSISTKLLELYTAQNQTLKERIEHLTSQKEANNDSNKLLFTLGMLPASDGAQKVLKYERSLQKSIYQNLIMLKRLQGTF